VRNGLLDDVTGHVDSCVELLLGVREIAVGWLTDRRDDASPGKPLVAIQVAGSSVCRTPELASAALS